MTGNDQIHRRRQDFAALKYIASLLGLLALYLQVKLVIPYGPFLLLGLFLLAISRLYWRETAPILLFFYFGLGYYALLLMRWLPTEALSEQFRSTGLFFLSITAGFGLFKGFSALRRKTIHKTFAVLSLALLLGALFEVLGPLKPVSDAVRSAIYSQGLYESDLRDLNIAGFIRPKLFTSEPSHLAKFLGLFIAIAALTTNRIRSKSWFLLMSLVALGLTASLGALAGVMVIFVNIGKSIGLRRLIKSPVIVFTAIAVSALIGWKSYTEAADRLGWRGGPVEASAFIRIIRPGIVAKEALHMHPVFGFGLGAESTLQEISLASAFDARSPLFVRKEAYGIFLFGNIHFAVFVQFGIIGTAIWLALLSRLQTSLCPSGRLEFWVFYGFFAISIGSLNIPLFWGPVFLIMLALGSGKRRVLPGTGLSGNARNG